MFYQRRTSVGISFQSAGNGFNAEIPSTDAAQAAVTAALTGPPKHRVSEMSDFLRTALQPANEKPRPMSTQALQPARSQTSFSTSTVGLPPMSQFMPQQPIPDALMPSRGVSLNRTPSVASSVNTAPEKAQEAETSVMAGYVNSPVPQLPIGSPSPSCNEPRPTFPSQADLDDNIMNHHPRRAFNCVFDFAGCKITFNNKTEWKRHVAAQHLLLNYWLCTEGACAATPSLPQPSHSQTQAPPPNGFVFNRKDGFVYHLNRMHAPEEIKHLLNLPKTGATNNKKPSPHKLEATSAELADVAGWEDRVRILQSAAIRTRCALPTSMRCPVLGCHEPVFNGADAWDQWMDHVAQHMAEKKVVFGGEGADTLVEWASRPDVAVIEHVEGYGGVPGGDVVDSRGNMERALRNLEVKFEDKIRRKTGECPHAIAFTEDRRGYRAQRRGIFTGHGELPTAIMPEEWQRVGIVPTPGASPSRVSRQLTQASGSALTVHHSHLLPGIGLVHRGGERERVRAVRVGIIPLAPRPSGN